MKTRTTSSPLIALLLACIALSPRAQAVVPAPDGGYPGKNTAEGQNALLSLNVNTGTNNTAVGWFSLKSNVGGQYNTAVGSGTLFNNTDSRNTAVGGAAMFRNTGGSFNTAVGMLSLFNNSTGTGNTAIGDGALFDNSTGHGNIALGNNAGHSLTGSGNIVIGSGLFGVPGEFNTTRVKNVYGSVASARIVYVNSDNKIGTVASTRRVKKDIKPMDKASEAVLALKPVSFRYKKEIDASDTLQFGLVAEEVADINADLVTRDFEGKPETVRYDAVNAMLLNEFLKEHRKNEEQEKTIAELKSGMTALAATVKEQATQIQKVSAQLEASRPAPQVVNNP